MKVNFGGFDLENGIIIICLPVPGTGQWQCVRNVGIKGNVNFNNCNNFANKVHIEMFAKFINLFLLVC